MHRRSVRPLLTPRGGPAGMETGMAEKEKTETRSEREKRLAAELRANLARRKAQARSRRAGNADERAEGIPTVDKDRRG
jgi:hypothetical protein